MDRGLYVLKVQSSASKNQIADELKKHFNIDVISVRVLNQSGKSVTFKRRKGWRSDMKKVYVQLKKGQKLPGFKNSIEKKETI